MKGGVNMDTLVEQYEHEGIPVEIHWDDNPMSPREWTNVGTILHWHRSYDFGESIEGRDMEAVERGGMKLLVRWLQLTRGATCVLPLGLLDHSGLHMWVGGGSHWTDSAGWDSGTVGVIFDTTESREETGVELENVEKALRQEIEEYDAYLRGEVYGYVVAHDEPDMDSCWGFIGDIKWAKEEAESSAEYIAKERRAKAEASYRAKRVIVARRGVT